MLHLCHLCPLDKLCFQVDLLENKSVDELCEKLSGKIDVLVINAGMADSGSVLEGGCAHPLRLSSSTHSRSSQ